MYDVVVAGGSVAGLLCAREAAAAGCSVLVAERGAEVGTPDHCGGLVSAAGLGELGLAPGAATLGGRVERARVSSPSGRSFEVRAPGGVLEVDRRSLDKEAARQAARAGARIETGAACALEGGRARVAGRDVECRVAVDARGAASPALRGRPGAVPSAQYEVHAPWIEPGTVEVLVDAELYPGFFAWVIPSAAGRGKVGAAGRGIAPARALEALLGSRGPHSVTRKVSAPVWAGGPAGSFVDGRTLAAGDAAGQAKPTTGGGIYSCGLGGALAGRAAAAYARTGDPADLAAYEAAWRARFGAEFRRQALARRVLERLDNAAIESLFASVTPEAAARASEGGDFDFHAASVARLLGARAALGAAGAVAASELRRLLRPGAAGGRG